MLSLWKQLTNVFVREREADGAMSAALRFAGAVRILLFQREHRELFTLEIFQRYIAVPGERDMLFHLSHRHYLSTRLTRRQRVECALTHYRYEAANYDGLYKDAVYRDDGIALWSQVIHSTTYALRLRASTKLRHEGAVSVLLCADAVCLSEMSFTWIDAKVFGSDLGIIPFITRNQSGRHDAPELLRFREAFPHNSPQYFCLAAMHGIATAHGLTGIAAIRYDCQIAFDERYATSFRNSYCDFWSVFDAVALDRQAYLMPVPLATPPLSAVKAKHRKRALNRRRHWWDIIESAGRSISRHRRPPLAVTSSLLQLICGAAMPDPAALLLMAQMV